MDLQASSLSERPVRFGRGGGLVGIVGRPDPGRAASGRPGLLILNAGGLPRTGPCRLGVKMARRCAELGFVGLRFDFSGLGDSMPSADFLHFEKSAVEDVRDAMDFLAATQGIRTFILAGLCSGAAISLRAAHQDPRVVGGILINERTYLLHDDPGSREALERKALRRHYFRIALASSFRGKTWRKALTGQVDHRGLLRSLFRSAVGVPWTGGHVGSVVEESAGQLLRLGHRLRLLLVHSEGDEGLDALHVLLRGRLHELDSAGPTRLEVIRGANHTFTVLQHQERLINAIEQWMAHWLGGSKAIHCK